MAKSTSVILSLMHVMMCISKDIFSCIDFENVKKLYLIVKHVHIP